MISFDNRYVNDVVLNWFYVVLRYFFKSDKVRGDLKEVFYFCIY